MGNLQLLYPEFLLGALALVMLLADLFMPARRGKILYHMGLVSAALTLGLLGNAYSNPGVFQGIGTLWIVDPLSLFFKILILVTTILVLLLTTDYLPEPPVMRHLGSFAALVLLSALGMMLLVSSSDLLMAFLALELISISSFILAGFERENVKSSEGAMKYFLIGAFSSACMLYGISLYYGATGTTSLVGVPVPEGPLYQMSLLFIIVGFGFKASVAPFHLWVPDAYEGAPTPVTAFLSVAPKVAALAAMMRVFNNLLPVGGDMIAVFSTLAVLTMTVGNLTALFQTNVKRLLAYSSIAQAGYMLIAFVAAGPMGRDGLLMYSLVYVFMNIGAFAVAIMLGNESNYELESYDGLAQRSFGIALLMAFFLLSLAGIPPLAGFIAKFYVFAAAIEAKYYFLAAIGVLNSVISAYYYLRVVYHMFFKPAKNESPVQAGLFLYSTLAVAAVGIIVIGIYPDPFIASVRLSSGMLPIVRDAVAPLAGR